MAAASIGWYPFSTISTSSDVRDVTFLDANNGWAVGDNGGLYQTRDGGATWTSFALGLQDNLTHVTFADAQDEYAIGASAILATHDGGQTRSRPAPRR